MSTPTAERAVSHQPKTKSVPSGLIDPAMLWRSVPDALRKLDPRTLWRNPVMFIVELGAVWSTVLAIADPTWFRRSPRDAARRRPSRCERPRPTPWPADSTRRAPRIRCPHPS